MKEVINFILLVFLVKLIEDNLPDLHYKKILNFFAPFILLAYIGYLSIIVKITKDSQQKKNFLVLLSIVAVNVILDKGLKRDKKQEEI
jgi:hypothetical protein